jgi:hypothetical protein
VTALFGRHVRLATVAAGVAGLMALTVTPIGAQDISINFAHGSGLTESVIQLIALAHRARHSHGATQCGNRVTSQN